MPIRSALSMKHLGHSIGSPLSGRRTILFQIGLSVNHTTFTPPQSSQIASGWIFFTVSQPVLYVSHERHLTDNLEVQLLLNHRSYIGPGPETRKRRPREYVISGLISIRIIVEQFQQEIL